MTGARGRRPWPHLWLEGLAGSALALVMAGSTLAGAHEAAPAFHAPGGEHVLTRMLRRTLGDGAEVVTVRRYAIRFIPEGEGTRVEGHQLDARVEAPAKLAALAAIERQRRDEGMFPFTLDAQGLIVDDQRPQAGAPTPGAATQTALHKVEAMLATAALADDQRRQAMQVAHALAGRFTTWPEDLFLPRTGATNQTRHYILPDGTPGAVTVTVVARLTRTGGRVASLDRLERTLTTVAAGQTRVSTEIWTLDHDQP